MPIPSTTPPPGWSRETPAAAVAGVAAVVAGTFAIAKELTSATRSTPQVYALGIALLGALSLSTLAVARARRKDAKEAKQETPDDLRGCLHVLHAAVRAYKSAENPGDGWLRITVHRLDGNTLEQSVGYVGSEDGGAGRRFSINAGLIGRVARVGQVRRVDRPADMGLAEWLHYLVEDGLTQEAAETTRRDRFAFLAVPIQSPGVTAVRAVVYLDAGTPDFFDDGTTALVIAGTEGLAAWVDEHYYRG